MGDTATHCTATLTTKTFLKKYLRLDLSWWGSGRSIICLLYIRQLMYVQGSKGNKLNIKEVEPYLDLGRVSAWLWRCWGARTSGATPPQWSPGVCRSPRGRPGSSSSSLCTLTSTCPSPAPESVSLRIKTRVWILFEKICHPGGEGRKLSGLKHEINHLHRLA